jgi:hypothetical protein
MIFPTRGLRKTNFAAYNGSHSTRDGVVFAVLLGTTPIGGRRRTRPDPWAPAGLNDEEPPGGLRRDQPAAHPRSSTLAQWWTWMKSTARVRLSGVRSGFHLLSPSLRRNGVVRVVPGVAAALGCRLCGGCDLAGGRLGAVSTVGTRLDRHHHGVLAGLVAARGGGHHRRGGQLRHPLGLALHPGTHLPGVPFG